MKCPVRKPILSLKCESSTGQITSRRHSQHFCPLCKEFWYQYPWHLYWCPGNEGNAICQFRESGKVFPHNISRYTDQVIAAGLILRHEWRPNVPYCFQAVTDGVNEFCFWAVLIRRGTSMSPAPLNDYQIGILISSLNALLCNKGDRDQISF